MTDEKSATVSKQDITNIFKAASKGRGSAGKLLWSFIDQNTNNCWLRVSSYKSMLPYKTQSSLRSEGADDLIVYKDLAEDLKFLQDIIVSEEQTEKCSYSVLVEEIKFIFPVWFCNNIKDYNPFQFCFEE